jgi:hypothetical protein
MGNVDLNELDVETIVIRPAFLSGEMEGTAECTVRHAGFANP